MPDQQGILRRRAKMLPPKLAGQPKPDALLQDVRALERALLDLARQVEMLENQLVTRVNEMLTQGTLANRPAAAVQNRIYLSTDQVAGSNLHMDTGTAWVLV